ncbi:MAG: sodium:solute symporter, partial [Chthoniobacterales bacterium]
MVFVFFQFEKPPMFFNQPAYELAQQTDADGKLPLLQARYDAVFAQKQAHVRSLTSAMQNGATDAAGAAQELVVQSQNELQALREELKTTMLAANPKLETKDSDYVFITFVLRYLPHGIIGLLVAVIFCAAMSSTAAELNALGSTTEVDFYRPLFKDDGSEAHYLIFAKMATAAWGLVAIGFALFANLASNLIEAVNILGSIFYGTILGLFLTAFFLKSVRGTAVFLAALLSQSMVLILFWNTKIGYLWYNLIGCVAVLLLASLLQKTIGRGEPVGS